MAMLLRLLDHHSSACLLSCARDFVVQSLVGHNSLAAINILAAIVFESANVANDAVYADDIDEIL